MDNPVINKFGEQVWYNDQNQIHNDSGPAVICESILIGSYQIGHSYKKWYMNGQLHNENGPAVVYTWGENAWYINGVNYSEEEFKQYKIKQFINNND